MKQIQFARTGIPSEVVACVDVPEPASPGPGEVLVQAQAFPINPADILTLRGGYARRADGVGVPGSEAVGVVVATGEGVANVAVGDRVIYLCRDNWLAFKCVPAHQVMPVPRQADLLQLAMLKVNPATAHCLLERFVALGADDWVIQNAANSGVGRSLTQLARLRGIRSISVVRRDDVSAELMALGATAVLRDGDDLAARVREQTGGARVALAVDAVGGAATARLADAVSDGATLVNYGGMQGEACIVRPDQLIFRDIAVRGFWLTRTVESMPYADAKLMYDALSGHVLAGNLHTPVEARYRAEEIQQAVAHAERGGRHGKVLVEFSN
ncbi:MDR family NADPH-dependent oxidoreductase [Tahibacter amnicola]|uniref:enoyl-[acyl-carrier-protein] reductase n=1 Tax=Tahibacter amnicola TaxID=2976241 RepID=A0ABY6BK80_9GAMM|nr:2-enoyl thioester reductase domain-containing protein [Tahibacter amnicola]UXI69485.1 2-enoyl thioester reductase domain-containing protein [Tahibacter amnicola]